MLTEQSFSTCRVDTFETFEHIVLYWDCLEERGKVETQSNTINRVSVLKRYVVASTALVAPARLSAIVNLKPCLNLAVVHKPANTKRLPGIVPETT
jgi:hypothetical protein